jgi:hypothetical protein
MTGINLDDFFDEEVSPHSEDYLHNGVGQGPNGLSENLTPPAADTDYKRGIFSTTTQKGRGSEYLYRGTGQSNLRMAFRGEKPVFVLFAERISELRNGYRMASCPTRFCRELRSREG